MPSLSDLKNTANPKAVERSSRTKIVGIRTRKNQRRFVFLAKSSESYSSPKGHLVSLLYHTLTFADLRRTERNDNTFSPIKSLLKVWCSCPAWQYWGSAYWATKFKYNLPDKREFRPPKIRDPKGTNPCCKHVIAVTDHISKYTFAKLIKRFRDHYTRKVRRTSSIVEPDDFGAIDFDNEGVVDWLDIVPELCYIFTENQIADSAMEAENLVMSLIAADEIEEYLEEKCLIVGDSWYAH